MLDAEELLDASQLRHRVLNQLVSVHHQDLLPREHLQPPMQVLVVQGDSYRSNGDNGTGALLPDSKIDHNPFR